MRHVNTGPLWLGLALLIVGLVTTSWAVLGLSDGLPELGRHWWSSLATLPLLAGLAVIAISLIRARRQSAGDLTNR
jgi:hypothetical protein